MKKQTRAPLLLGFALGILLPFQGTFAQSIYAPLGEANQIARINANNTKVQKLYGNLENPHGLAVTPDGSTLFAASLMEKAEQPEQAMDRPEGVSDADHNAHHGGTAPLQPAAPKTFSFITELDVVTGKILRRIDVQKFTHHLTVSPDGAYVIGVQSGAGRIVVVDAKTGRVLRYVPVGLAPNYALVTRDGGKVFISSAGTDTVTVLDGKTWLKIASIKTGKGPEHMTFSPDEKTLYAVNVGSNELSVIDTETLRETRRIPTGNSPHGVAFSKSTKTVIVTNRGDDTLSVFTATGEPTQTVPLSPQPYHITDAADGSNLWVSSRKEGQVWLISPKELVVQKTLEVPGIAHQIVVVP